MNVFEKSKLSTSGLTVSDFFESRRLLVTTKTLLMAMAPAARMGINKPNAATGMRTIL